MKRVMEYPWPGNIRELENLIERAIIITKGAELNITGISEMSDIAAGCEDFRRLESCRKRSDKKGACGDSRKQEKSGGDAGDIPKVSPVQDKGIWDL